MRIYVVELDCRACLAFIGERGCVCFTGLSLDGDDVFKGPVDPPGTSAGCCGECPEDVTSTGGEPAIGLGRPDSYSAGFPLTAGGPGLF